MNITRHNYEEYFILYLDNELSSEGRRQVEIFIDENPDLITDLDLLMQSRFAADTSVVFQNKEQLMKSSGSVSINRNNYEEWLLSYTDNELTTEEKDAVEKFMGLHPEIKKELDILRKTKLEPETITFPYKESLYRREEKVRVVAISWRRIAVAAALLLAVSSTALIIFTTKKQPAAGAVANNSNEKKTTPATQNTRPGTNEEATGSAAVAENPDAISETNISANNPPVYSNKKSIEPDTKVEQKIIDEVKQEEVLIADISEEKKKSNDLPQPVYNPNVNRVNENPIAMNDFPDREALTDPKQTIEPPTVTPTNLQPLNNVVLAANEEPARKNKLRGFFRKVTRTFEKNTNIKATDDEDRLLLGGLAIKL